MIIVAILSFFVPAITTRVQLYGKLVHIISEKDKSLLNSLLKPLVSRIYVNRTLQCQKINSSTFIFLAC